MCFAGHFSLCPVEADAYWACWKLSSKTTNFSSIQIFYTFKGKFSLFSAKAEAFEERKVDEEEEEKEEEESEIEEGKRERENPGVLDWVTLFFP